MAKKVKVKAKLVRRTATRRSPAPPKAMGTRVTVVRNSAIPKPAAKKPTIVTYDMIAKRAYEIWQSGTGGSEQDNWCRAERELRGA